MRYIDRTNCKSIHEKGNDAEITRMGALTRKATKIAESAGLGLLKSSHGDYRIIRASGLGAYTDYLNTLAEVDDYLKHLDDHKAARLY